MTVRLARSLLALLLPFALAGCLLVPGKFVSTLTVNADRSFAFSYVGEVVAIDAADGMKGLGDSKDADVDPSAYDDAPPTLQKLAFAADDDTAEAELKMKAIAEALSKEAGYRKVEYLGDRKFHVDYAIAGTLTHNFIYPFNIDALAVMPFVAIELRANGTVRVKAPAFGNETAGTGGSMAGQATNTMDGTFTLDTNAEIVSQNDEAGATTGADGRKRVTWKVTPLTKAAPMAVLRVK